MSNNTGLKQERNSSELTLCCSVRQGTDGNLEIKKTYAPACVGAAEAEQVNNFRSLRINIAKSVSVLHGSTLEKEAEEQLHFLTKLRQVKFPVAASR